MDMCASIHKKKILAKIFILESRFLKIHTTLNQYSVFSS